MRALHFASGAVVLPLALAACGVQVSGPPSSNASDTTAPTVSITSPTASSTYSTASAAISLAGRAADDTGVVSVGWRNAANGASGSAIGTSSWSVPSIALVSGVNTLTVTARDTAGNPGSATLAVTYNPSGAVSLSGNVDSSLINRGGTNTVYLYNGTVTPGSTTPAATTTVTQDRGACTFSYWFGTMPAGTYTVALSSDGATFRGTATVTVASGATAHDFSPNRLLQVGATRALKTPSTAAAVAQSGDVIEIDAGEYLDDIVVWRQNNLTLRGVGGRAHMRATQIIPFVPGGTDRQNGMGIWVQSAQNTSVENIEFSGASVPDQNGAGIRANGSGLTVCNCYFHDNEDGILGGAGVVLVEYSEFNHNGFGDGQSHNMYFSQSVTRFTLRYSYSHRAKIGHNVKSRAQENHILYNRITDEADGTASYEIDLPNAGLSFIIGNLIQQGPQTDNSTIIIYGEEGVPAGFAKELYVVNNTIVNDLGSGRFIDSLPPGTTARFMNNIFAGGGTVASGVGITSTNNLVSNSPGLVDSANFDYHLASTSPARNAGTDPGSVGAVSLVPTSQYLHPINREDRPVDGAIDIGAYEFR